MFEELKASLGISASTPKQIYDSMPCSTSQERAKKLEYLLKYVLTK